MYGKCCCQGCTDRYLGCHDKCEKYSEYRKELDKKNNERAKILAENAPFHEIKAKWTSKKLKSKGYF